MSKQWYWYIFADGYRACVKGYSVNELRHEEFKHGKLITKILA